MATIHRTSHLSATHSSRKQSSSTPKQSKPKKKTDDFTVIRTEEIPLNFYAVRSKDGKWLRAKGYGGGGESWVEDIAKAKIYSNTRAPKSQITFWANKYPSFGVPDLVRITVGKCEYLDQSTRVKDNKIKKDVKEAETAVSRWTYNLEIHNRKVIALRGDGNDSESIRLRKGLDQANVDLLKAKENLENHKKMK
jgi:hypothetical protein